MGQEERQNQKIRNLQERLEKMEGSIKKYTTEIYEVHQNTYNFLKSISDEELIKEYNDEYNRAIDKIESLYYGERQKLEYELENLLRSKEN